jgi:23S rRNA U2552 (ribose-2'-O)-methylase RlmE/FtsJ
MRLGCQATNQKLLSCLLVADLTRGNNRKALDLCAGEGGFTRVLMACGYAVTSMDSDRKLQFSPEYLKGKIRLFPADRLVLDLDVETFKKRYQELPSCSYHFVVSDGFMSGDAEPSRSEYSPVTSWNSSARLLVAQMQMIKYNLELGGSCVLKLLGVPLDAGDLVLYQLSELVSCFRTLFIVKPEASCAASIEYYLVLRHRELLDGFVEHPGLAGVCNALYKMLMHFSLVRRRRISKLFDLFSAKFYARKNRLAILTNDDRNMSRSRNTSPDGLGGDGDCIVATIAATNLIKSVGICPEYGKSFLSYLSQVCSVPLASYESTSHIGCWTSEVKFKMGPETFYGSSDARPRKVQAEGVAAIALANRMYAADKLDKGLVDKFKVANAGCVE